MGKGRLADAIRRARNHGRAAFIPYITAGDPDLDATSRFARGLEGAGADVIELGVPFTDPFADGPVNQRAAQRALAGGTTLVGILDGVSRMRADGLTIPIVLFTYFNPVLRMGLEAFCTRSRKAGVDGALIVDLPPEEAAVYLEHAGSADLETVFLASPTTTTERLQRIDAASSGFLYYVSRLGVTGTRDRLSSSLGDELDRVRTIVSGPLAVGFGISTPIQAAEVASRADAVVVGSALVRFAQDHPVEEAARRMADLTKAMVTAMAQPPAQGE